MGVARFILFGAMATILFCLGFFLAAVVVGCESGTAAFLGGAFAAVGLAIIFGGGAR